MQKSKVYFEYDIETFRLTGRRNIDQPAFNWVQIDQLFLTNIISGTRKWHDYAFIDNDVFEIPVDLDLTYLSHLNSDIWPEITHLDFFWSKFSWLPIDAPKIEPDDWDLFWKLWNERNKPVIRADYPNDPDWNGICCYTNPDLLKNPIKKVQLMTHYAEDWIKYFPKMFDRIFNVVPHKYIERVIIWQNIDEINPHFDPDHFIYPWPNTLRIMLWDSNDDDTFYMTKWPKRSDVFTKEKIQNNKFQNNDLLYGIDSKHAPMENREYIKLKDLDTNTFVINNGMFLHGADLAKPKLILVVKGAPDITNWFKILKRSYNKYKNIL